MKTENSNKAYGMAAIILSYLRDRISDEDRDGLNVWLAESEENRLLFDQIKNEEVRGRELRKMFSRNLPGAWQAIQQNVKKRRQRRIRRICQIAAMVVALVGSVLFFRLQLWQSSQSVEMAETVSVISPGRATAKLTVAGGTTYLLDSVTTDVLPNTSIRNGNEIVFRDADSLMTAQAGNVQYNTLEIPRGGEYKITLADGTEVYLNSQTEFRFPDQFTGARERIVYLSGEAFFKVKKNEKQPFIVKCGDYSVKVLGTSFNISNYADNNYAHTTLAEGKVEVLRAKERVTLVPGQQARVISGHLEVREVNVKNYTTWMNDNFRFEGENIDEILKRIARWYAVDIFYVNQSVRNYHFSGYLPRYANISDVLELLSLTTDIRFDIKDKTVLVMKK